MPFNRDKPHLILKPSGTSISYTSPVSPRDGSLVHDRIRADHGKRLLNQLETLAEESEELKKEREALGLKRQGGIVVEIESAPDHDLRLESLDSSGFVLLSTRDEADRQFAQVLIPDGKLSVFVKKIEDYLSKDTNPKEGPGAPRNARLVQNIENIRKAALDALWTDHPDIFPSDDEAIWWEVWLAHREDDSPSAVDYFKNNAEKFSLRVNPRHLQFPERTVVLVFGKKSDLARSFDLLNCISEIRTPASTAHSIMNMSPSEMQDWASDLQTRIDVSLGPVRICILDTGLNIGNPLLENVVSESELYSLESAWDPTDSQGHGTQMAGLALYGDLIPLLKSGIRVEIRHGIESVKILNDFRNADREYELYGHVTVRGAAKAEIGQSDPDQKRIFLMAVSASECDGRPSSWSAAIDQMSSGFLDNHRRLIVLSAGNTVPKNEADYPVENHASGIEDPGQSFNALTVGGYTEKVYLSPEEGMDYKVLASAGALAPTSRTSVPWSKEWPYKPDLVYEGGNMAYDSTGFVSAADSLSLLTTHHETTKGAFTTTGMTSAAAAGVARIAAELQTAYPSLSPESIRGLLIHTAEWTEVMRKGLYDSKPDTVAALLRLYGYGVPSIEAAKSSAENAAHMIIEDSLSPFREEGSQIRTGDLKLYELPWPDSVLMNLAEEEVEFRVTLSYFVEPDPARRGFKNKFQYQSHGLRFAIKRPTEGVEDFRKRINRADREEDDDDAYTREVSGQWLLGSQKRTRGSLHHDRWTGTAADLASSGAVAVYPVGGWWRYKKNLGSHNKLARFSLILSIHTKDTDIYTPILNEIQVTA